MVRPTGNVDTGRPHGPSDTMAPEGDMAEDRRRRGRRGDVHAVGDAGGGTAWGGLGGSNIGHGDPTMANLQDAAGSGSSEAAEERVAGRAELSSPWVTIATKICSATRKKSASENASSNFVILKGSVRLEESWFFLRTHSSTCAGVTQIPRSGSSLGMTIERLGEESLHEGYELLPLLDGLGVLSFLGDLAEAVFHLFDAFVELCQFVGKFLDDRGELFDLFVSWRA